MSYLTVYNDNDSCNHDIDDLDIFSYKLDNFQLWGCYKIQQNENVLCCCPTGSGKTVNAIYGIHNTLKKNKKVIYTSPIKALANQKYKEFCERFGSELVGIFTGDIKFNPTAQILICTAEILRNMLYNDYSNKKENQQFLDITIDEIDTVIMDEIHYINDNDRGLVWEETLILLPKSINLIMMSATIHKAEEFAGWIGKLKEKPINLIQKSGRNVPLTYYYYNNQNLIQIGNSDKKFMNYDLIKENYSKTPISKLINPFVEFLKEKNLFPALLFLFSRAKCDSYSKLIQKNLLTSEESCEVIKIFDNKIAPFKKIYEKTPQYNQIRDLLKKGIGVHHSGYIPILKEIVEILLERGLIKLVITTETFAVGFNAPIKTSVFTSLMKYSDGGHRYLRTDEFLQIAGRAGRRGLDKIGTVIMLPIHDYPDELTLKKMLVGKPFEIISKFYFTYNFILKIIDSKNLKLDNFLNISLYNVDNINNLKSYNHDLNQLSIEIKNYDFNTTYLSQLETYYNHNSIMSDPYIKINSKKLKKMKSELEKIKSNIQNFDSHYKSFQQYNQLIQKKTFIQKNIDYLQSINSQEINSIIDFLYKNDYITFNDSINIFNLDTNNYFKYYNDLIINKKGLIAKQIAECNELLLTEILTNNLLYNLNSEEIITVLAIFIEEKTIDGENLILDDLDITSNSIKVIKQIQSLSSRFDFNESKYHLNTKTDWNIYLGFVQPAYMWIQNKSIYEIKSYSQYEGNFIKNIIKINNILENIKSICMIIEDYDLLYKIQDLYKILIRDQVTLESLYI